MYCKGDCNFLNERRHICSKTGKKLAYCKFRGAVKFSIHEHEGFCEENERKEEQIRGSGERNENAGGLQ